MSDRINNPEDLLKHEQDFMGVGEIKMCGAWMHEMNGVQAIFVIYDRTSFSELPWTERRYAVAVNGRCTGGGIIDTLEIDTSPSHA